MNTIKNKQSAAHELKAIAEKNNGVLTPEVVVDTARNPKHPLHSHFVWNNTKAGEAYRKLHAAHLIRKVKVTLTGPDQKEIRVRQYVNVHANTDADESPNERGFYVDHEAAMKSQPWRDELMEQCKRDAKAFRCKYAALQEAAKIIDEMNSLIEDNA